MQSLKTYFQKTRSYSTWRFIAEMTVLAFFLKIVAILIAVPIFASLGINTETNLEIEKSFLEYHLWQTIIMVILFAAFETVTGQMLILWVAKKISRSLTFRIISSAVVFALLHVEPLLVVAVFPIGLILAWSYVIYREKSLWSAFWVTTAIHVLHNLFALWLVSLG